ncbi:hypothetical protein LVJ94_30665 [Pendulispora rubella]|uniref:Uncharacterized protein n=1 Tax=Pendulispora rubella TaxID=2741070 RepID=A0ABZ2KRI5_9BACT
MKPRRAPSIVVASALLLGMGVGTTTARADLREVATRARLEWRNAGAVLVDTAPRFLFEGDTVTIRIPPTPGTARCTTIGFIGARGVSFHAQIAQGKGDSGDDLIGKSASMAGLLELVRCSGAPVERVVLTGDAGRGAVEVVVARSKAPLPSLRTVFPERTGGVLPPTQEPGTFPPLPPIGKRVDVAEARARADGGTVQKRSGWESADDGSGVGEVELEAGCHRIELFAAEPPRASGGSGPERRGGRRFRFDLDAELRDGDDDRLLARDRTDTADARLDACVGGPTAGNVVFVGAGPRASIVGMHATWPIPEGLPRIWGPDTRARMAAALLARRLSPKDRAPVLVVQGASGVTPVPVQLEAGACYIAVAAVAFGNARGVGLRAIIGGNESADERGHNDNSGVVAFCTHERTRGRLEVEARGIRMAWGLALYRVESGAWELPR